MSRRRRSSVLDGSRPVHICYEPELHREWKTKLAVVALVSFAAGVLVQWFWLVLPQ